MGPALPPPGRPAERTIWSQRGANASMKPTVNGPTDWSSSTVGQPLSRISIRLGPAE